MAVCARSVKRNGDNFIVIDTTVTDPYSCEYIVSTGKEGFVSQLASLSPDEALIISTHVAMVWAVAWTIRMVARAINMPDESETE